MTTLRKVPVTWTHQEVSVLTKLHGLHGDTPEGLHKTEKSFERHTPADVRDKLIELGLIPKPVKPTLGDEDRGIVTAGIDKLICSEEPQRTLEIRHAIVHLQSLLPKRAPKVPK
jgi:hypothetical protein